MKKTRPHPVGRSRPARKTVGLQARLTEAEATLRAIRLGEVDAVVVAGGRGPQVFTLQGAEHAYRMLIESMNEGALTLAADKTVLYANACFARMVRCPLERVIGGSFRRFLSPADLRTLRPLLRGTSRHGTKLQVMLRTGHGAQIPVQVSIRRLARNGFTHAPVGLVVTDLTEARRTEGLLRALANRVVQVQEAERSRIARELHDHITQPLCAVLFRSAALAGRLGPARREARALHRMLSLAAGEVERISRELRPGVLEQLGLVLVLRDTGKRFTTRTGVPVRLTGGRLAGRLPPAIELALYRIFQEALHNIEQHARARRVAVDLRLEDGGVRLAITDDGIGLKSNHRPAGPNPAAGLGLLAMRERANHLGGKLTLKSRPRAGTSLVVHLPLSSAPVAPA